MNLIRISPLQEASNETIPFGTLFNPSFFVATNIASNFVESLFECEHILACDGVASLCDEYFRGDFVPIHSYIHIYIHTFEGTFFTYLNCAHVYVCMNICILKWIYEWAVCFYVCIHCMYVYTVCMYVSMYALSKKNSSYTPSASTFLQPPSLASCRKLSPPFPFYLQIISECLHTYMQ